MNTRIQIIRALAIIAVVFIHTPVPAPYVVFIRPFINPAVAMFLFLSAYLTTLERADVSCSSCVKLVKRRLFRVVTPYIAWVLIVSLPALFETSPIKAFARDVFYEAWGAPYYFFLVYIQLTLLLPWSVRLLGSTKRLWGVAVSPLAVSAIYFLRAEGIELPGMSTIIPFVVWYSFYYLGLLLGQKQQRCLMDVWAAAVIWAALVVLQMADGWMWYANGSLSMAISTQKASSFLTSIALCILAHAYVSHPAIACSGNSLIKRFLVYIGNCSMGIFLCHCVFIRVWHMVEMHFHFSMPFLVFGGVVILSCLCLIFCVNKLLPEKIVALSGLASGKSRPFHKA